jgi:hypothetical protein
MLCCQCAIAAPRYNRILIPPDCHPAVSSAARLIASGLELPESAIIVNKDSALPAEGQIVLTAGTPAPFEEPLLNRHSAGVKRDGYSVVAEKGGLLIHGARPRSLLFAAGEVQKWKGLETGTLLREPSFSTRSAYFRNSRSVADFVAKMGVNALIVPAQNLSTLQDSMPEVFNRLGSEQQSSLLNNSRYSASRVRQLAGECRDADVDFFPFLYGNDFSRWSGALYDALIAAYPSARGTPSPESWERATLCPSDPATWKAFEAYVKEFAQRSGGSGVCATFWDNYGINCQCDRCQRNGMNQFSNQLYACVMHYRAALAPLNQKLVVRTWSSGVPHWINGQWVHAPGNSGLSGTGAALWSRVIADLPADVILQTKVYDADCQPDPPFSSLLGHAAPHGEIAEYQITGQTTGRFYFPASTVNHTAWTMRKSYQLIGAENGVNVDVAGAKNPDFELLDDIANSINAYAWRELSWDVSKDVGQIWTDWAVPIYGERAAPHVIKALQLSEDAVNRLFSTLGMGSDTDSGFATEIKRRETLLKYTNRYFNPDYAKFLEPTKENIQRVIDEKTGCLKSIDEMIHELELARPNLRNEQAEELATRFNWLREFAIVNRHLDESLWRYRYLRYQASMLTTDPEQIKFLAASYDAVEEHRAKLFQFNPNQKFSSYGKSLGRLSAAPSLGNPSPLMRQLYDESRKFVEEFVGPEGVPVEWRR